MAIAPSPNFSFLAKVDELLVDLAARAEVYAFTDPNTALVKTRQFGEIITKMIFSKVGRSYQEEERQVELINELWRARLIPDQISQLLHQIRKIGNDAVHKVYGEQGEALYHLKTIRKIGVWFFKTFHDRHYKVGAFVPPPNPKDATDNLKSELESLRNEYIESEKKVENLAESLVDEAQLRLDAEKHAEELFSELQTALELGEEDNERLSNRIQELESSLNLGATADSPEVREKRPDYKLSDVSARAEEVAAEVLSEADTRELIDRQLLAAGWTVNSKTIRHSKGSRPQKNKNIAIAEWPTSSGPADYVLFVGLTAVAVIEAKKKTADVAGAISQAKRYSRDYVFRDDEQPHDQPWGEYKIPFLFSTNGRPYLKQLRTKSGIWFLDARRGTNHPRALVDWFNPRDLRQMLTQDVDEAEQQLDSESPDYLPLRPYQQHAVEAVVAAIKRGQREMLVAMATGTGKTRTCIGICYRLIKAKRFRRILFLVDRTSLGEQTADSLKDVRLENNQTFTDIYDVKELGDIAPDDDTKFQIATIQGMVRRLLETDEKDSELSVGQYDCIVVDECHRGYNLDQELSENELRFRNQDDYISKYSRVIEYFDAVKIGLTATPALHTLEIFGGEDQLPVYQYSYRQAVLDGFLTDHEPPIKIRTKLGEEGIRFEKDEDLQVYNTGTQQLELFKAPDEIELEIESFNKKVINENFNRVICEELTKHIDPQLPGKTLIFCVTDHHADMVVDELKSAYGDDIHDDAIKKITGAADKPLQLIRRYKNEQLPKIAVTVDLLTTGIDVPAITNLVFLRRVRSRILYEQMLGRGTRLCEDLHGPDQDKEVFHVFDCVDIYSALKSHSEMQPVVNRPDITFSQLIDELQKTSNPEDLAVIKEQLIAKLQRKKRKLKGKNATSFEDKSGTSPESLVKQLTKAKPTEIAEWFADKTNLIEFLDSKISSHQKVILSDHEDEVTNVSVGFGEGDQRPKDYLEEFRAFVTENQDKIKAIKLCATRPRDLTRKALKELRLKLDEHNFNRVRLRVAWRETGNAEVTASIIGFIRNAILGTPLLPFEERVDRAMREIMTSQQWTKPQRQWLERIGKQFKENTLVDRDSFDQDQFREHGGFDRLNKVFDGRLADLLGEITDQIWSAAA